MKVRAPNIHPFAANGHFSLYYRPFFSLSSYYICSMKQGVNAGWMALLML